MQTPSTSQPQTGATSKAMRAQRIALAACAAAALLAYFLVPAVNASVNSVFAMFATGDFSAASAFMEQYGPATAAVSFLLMVFQSVIAPLPAFMITITNANLFGWWQGAILSWASAMAGAALCFWIARVLGRGVVEKLAGKKGIAQAEDYFKRYGKHTILVCRLLPFVSFDWVSYFAGLTSMSFLDFLIATGVGQLPATIVYSYVGGMLTGGARLLMMGLLILFALAIVIFVAGRLYAERNRSKAAANADQAGENASSPTAE